MGKVEVVRAKKPQSQEQLWFRSKTSGAIYRRGPNGLCIASTGKIAFSNYGGAVYDVFDGPEYEPLLPGDQIIITL